MNQSAEEHYSNLISLYDNVEVKILLKLTHSSDIWSINILYCTILDISCSDEYWDETISCRNILYVDIRRFKSGKRECLLDVLDIDEIVVLKLHC
jgi:hypothetical protein